MRPETPKNLWVINKMFLVVLLLLVLEITTFMAFWAYHRLDYVRTGCDQFKRAGFVHITKDSKLYSVSLDQDRDGVDCE